MSKAAFPLQVRNLCLMRGSATLVESFGFEVPAGRYLEVVGPNGSGKSTLLRTVAGLQPQVALRARWPARGEVFLFEQTPALRGELPVPEQFVAALEPFAVRLSAEQQRLLLQKVGLGRSLHKRVEQLSEGQRRRLVLAVMAASQRRVWLVDEPANALDAAGIALFTAMLREHLAEGGVALIATHRRLSDLDKQLGQLCHARIELSGRSAQVVPQAATATPPGRGEFSTRLCANPLGWALRREARLAMAAPRELVWPGVFHWMILSLIPFAIGTDPQQLARIAPGMVWVSALLVTLLTASRHLEADFRSGILAQLKAAGFSISALVAGKILAHWLLFGLPMALYSVPLALQYHLDGTGIAALALSLAAGTLPLGALTLLFGALGLMARQAQVLISLMAFPVFVPVLVFGVSTVAAAQAGQNLGGPLAVLAGISALALLLVPPVARRVIDLALE